MALVICCCATSTGFAHELAAGVGTQTHLAAENFIYTAGIDVTHVPYKGMGAAYTDLVGGQVKVSFPTIISSLTHVKAGRLRTLAVTPGKRVPALPDVPTFAEAGVKGVVVVNWYGLIAPKKTPQAIIDRIAADTAKAMHLPDMEKRLIADGSEGVGGTPQAFADHIRAETKQWSGVIRQSGIRVD